MNRKLANRHQWRIEMARSIIMACNGDIDKAMKHEKMPYKKKSTVVKLAKESECFKDTEISKPRSGRLTEEEIERIHSVFIETDGYIEKTAQRTGFGKSTVQGMQEQEAGTRS